MIVQISDLHVGAAGRPLADARDAIDAVRALRPAPEALLVTGDLAEHGSRDEYAQVRELLAGLPMPVHVLPGNHDDRAALLEAFPAGGVAGSRYRWAATCGALRVVGCDSTRRGRDDGRLGPDDRAWLRETLAAEPRRPTIVAMHHAPLATGMPALDELGLAAADRHALGLLLRDFPQVHRVATGHLHMAACGRLGPATVISSPSTWRQRARLRIGARDWEIGDEPAGMLVHVLVDGEVITHVQPFGSGHECGGPVAANHDQPNEKGL